MKIKAAIKKLMYRYNPIARYRRRKMQKELKNITPSFLCPNCIGGILLHDLNLQFRSPTINLMMEQQDFAKFAACTRYYLEQDLVFLKKEGFKCPCAKLDDITIHFTHYASAQEASSKWNERKKRIDWDNLFIFASERDGLTKEQIVQMGSIRCKGLVVFTANQYPDIPYAVQILKYAAAGEVGNILKKRIWDESREYEQYFDFVKWFNEANGAPYDVLLFKK